MTPPPIPFVDHHVHFLATAAARLSLDVSSVRSLPELAAALSRAAPAPGTGWVRAWGYDEAFLQEGRHPTTADLDRARPEVPVVLHHRTGHGAVLNSRALREIGHPDPGPAGGLLVDRHDLLAAVPRLDPAALREAARQVSGAWARRGIGAFVDATATNGAEQIELLASWCRDGVIEQQVTAMVSPDHLAEVPGHGSAVGSVRIGPAKIMPGPDLDRVVAAAHAGGFPVAVHVTDIDVLESTLDALKGSPPPPGTRDRIEHNALSLPEQVARIAEVGAVVVVNPSFLIHRRPRYEREVPEVERAWLVRVRSLIEAGIDVRAGSDSPVAPADPSEMVAAAMAHPFSPGESVDRETALALLRP